MADGNNGGARVSCLCGRTFWFLFLSHHSHERGQKLGCHLELKDCKILEEGWAHSGDKIGCIVDDRARQRSCSEARAHRSAGIPDRPINRKEFE